jgi:hypothetical protein
MHHERIFTGPNVVDFLRPGMLADDLGLDMPTVLDERGQPKQVRELGMPVYSFGSRMGDDPRYIDSALRRSACVHHVKAHGGEQFFEKPGWRCELLGVWQAAAGGEDERYETRFEQRNTIFESLKMSRQLLEERLKNMSAMWPFPGALPAVWLGS